MRLDDELRSPRETSLDAEGLGKLASAALDHQREDQVLPLLRDAARSSRNARLWQWKGLLERALDEHAEALDSFAAASALAPTDVSIAHGHARIALEAGVPATDLFMRALRLAPQDPQIYLGLNAARLAEGRGVQAEVELEQLLDRTPTWVEGHQQLAQLRSLLGRRQHAFDTLEAAIAKHPSVPNLWQTLCELQVAAADYASLERTTERARRASPAAQLALYEFIAAAELGNVRKADALLAGGAAAAIGPSWRIRHDLRSGRLELAGATLDAELGGPRAADVLPYAEIAWRISGDARLEWLTANPNLVSVIDLGSEFAAIEGLSKRLRSLHSVSGRYLNQSVRGGSQTDGPLFSRMEPEIRALRSLVSSAVERHLAELKHLPDGHPQKRLAGTGPVRFNGSWSVRLANGGFHAAHVHPRGWISSALYVVIPSGLSSTDGCLTLGEPPAELGLGLPPARVIEPKVGQLVLFPSWMFHGTRPFPEGERLTVAFDVAPPAGQ